MLENSSNFAAYFAKYCYEKQIFTLFSIIFLCQLPWR